MRQIDGQRGLQAGILQFMRNRDTLTDDLASLIRRGVATAEEIEWARIHLVGLRAWQLQEYNRDRDFDTSFESRDEGMAYIARVIREIRFPSAKTALWAHNAHIATGGDFLRGPLTMGYFLKEDLGRNYEALALIAHESRIDWPGVVNSIWATKRGGWTNNTWKPIRRYSVRPT